MELEHLTTHSFRGGAVASIYRPQRPVSHAPPVIYLFDGTSPTQTGKERT
jgi:hypothetical protein